MKYMALIAALTLIAAPLAAAQDKPASVAAKPPAQEAPKPMSQEPAKPAAEAKAPAKPGAMAKHPKRNEDARRCLELEGNSAIIKCAEEYL